MIQSYVCDDKFIKIYDTLNSIDKKKFEHIPYNDILDAKTIIMYDIHLTDIYVKQILDYSWIELIKFKETRNYVQRVLENYNVYRYILEKKPIPMKNFFNNHPLF